LEEEMKLRLRRQGRIDDRVKKNSAKKREKIFAKQATKRKWSCSQV